MQMGSDFLSQAIFPAGKTSQVPILFRQSGETLASSALRSLEEAPKYPAPVHPARPSPLPHPRATPVAHIFACQCKKDAQPMKYLHGQTRPRSKTAPGASHQAADTSNTPLLHGPDIYEGGSSEWHCCRRALHQGQIDAFWYAIRGRTGCRCECGCRGDATDYENAPLPDDSRDHLSPARCRWIASPSRWNSTAPRTPPSTDIHHRLRRYRPQRTPLNTSAVQKR